VIEAGAMIGQRPSQTFSQTLPELKIAMRGWQRAHGIDPDQHNGTNAMSRDRLNELAERYKFDGKC